MVRWTALLTAALLLGACTGGTGSDRLPTAEPGVPVATQLDEELREELLTMAEQDQGERTSGATLTDEQRTDRLREIVDEHGWPTYDLVGEEGEDAAWLIAQHSDLDPDFQAEALELLRAAVAEGQASPGNLAYLEDRVRAGRGEPQLYGTQTGCTRQGTPAQPEIEDPAGLDERREAAGLPPYERYLRTMTRVCGQG
jgi:hypothetical protein